MLISSFGLDGTGYLSNLSFSKSIFGTVFTPKLLHDIAEGRLRCQYDLAIIQICSQYTTLCKLE